MKQSLCRVEKSLHAVGAEIVMLSLFTIGHDRRACACKAFPGVSNGKVIERSEFAVLALCVFGSLHPVNESGDTPDRLGGYRDWRRLNHSCRLAQSIIHHACGVNRRVSFLCFDFRG
jgi:hypothetical protein